MGEDTSLSGSAIVPRHEMIEIAGALMVALAGLRRTNAPVHSRVNLQRSIVRLDQLASHIRDYDAVMVVPDDQ